jgi:NAD(P)-dependent dehydrogenase (short-subunit alcohol dehydrogenase family)
MSGTRQQFGNLFDLSGRVALITGAGAGFGEVISIGFAEYGCDIAAADIDLKTAKRTAERVLALGRHSVAIQVDVKNAEAVKNMVDTAVRSIGTIDILINCAGVPQAHHDTAENITEEDWDRIIDINLKGTFLCCQAAAPYMLKKGKGAIINFSSIHGIVGGGRGHNVYCASKGGINGLTLELALEWAKQGIRVNAMAPCQFRTPALLSVWAEKGVDAKELERTVISNIPLGRIGEAGEIVGPALFLASDASSMVTGVILPVDGGYLAR